MTPPQLSEKVRELIKKSRIVSFQTWHEAYPVEVIHLFQAADDQSRYLTDEDLAQIRDLLPAITNSTATVQQLRDQVSDIVDQARASVMATFPNITEPGGGLYPAERASACWRDFWHFLRCITYGIAGQRTDYTSPNGLYHMQLLYQELKVPLDAMVVGLEGIKQSSLQHLQGETAHFEPYFDHLITQLKQFR
ncbi:MAG: phycobilisome protein [Leptolyngbyaceae cyanobacterium]